VGLTASQVVALRELAEPITSRELANRMSCEPSNVTFVVDRLERLGLVRRQPHPRDRRAKEIVLTAEGEDRRADVLELLTASSPLRSLTGEQQRALVTMLEVLDTQRT
jgi:MarR family transcriptional regulator, organic hydroperoxide resistance regulator